MKPDDKETGHEQPQDESAPARDEQSQDPDRRLHPHHGKAPEPPGNLRRRADWFRKRTETE